MSVGRIIFIMVLAVIFTLISCQPYAEKNSGKRSEPETRAAQVELFPAVF